MTFQLGKVGKHTLSYVYVVIVYMIISNLDLSLWLQFEGPLDIFFVIKAVGVSVPWFVIGHLASVTVNRGWFALGVIVAVEVVLIAMKAIEIWETGAGWAYLGYFGILSIVLKMAFFGLGLRIGPKISVAQRTGTP